MNEIKGYLRDFRLSVPDVIYDCKGIKIFGRRIKSIIFSTDVSILRNSNADAVIAVYPFTPQPVITQAVMMVADCPVFVGVGGGLTKGERVINLARHAEYQGA
ncbi:MAG: hydrolase, partial [Clostridia bacterium]|nr:hydrolase [Clostridia bacterium]